MQKRFPPLTLWSALPGSNSFTLQICGWQAGRGEGDTYFVQSRWAILPEILRSLLLLRLWGNWALNKVTFDFCVRFALLTLRVLRNTSTIRMTQNDRMDSPTICFIVQESLAFEGHCGVGCAELRAARRPQRACFVPPTLYTSDSIDLCFHFVRIGSTKTSNSDEHYSFSYKRVVFEVVLEDISRWPILCL